MGRRRPPRVARAGRRRGGGRPRAARAAAGPAVTALLLTASLAPTAACGGGAGGGAGHTVSPSGPSAAAVPRAVGFGDTYAFPDGLKVRVSQPAPFTPSVTSVGHQQGRTPVTFTVTVTNGTKAPFDASGLLVSMTAGAQGARVEQVFDSARGVGNPFPGPLAPGRDGTGVYAFDVPSDATKAVDVAVRPNYGVTYGTVHWTGRAR
ncbi:hypothetical protein ACFP1Z_24800 [Streptomyces gamaensis]|uniref:DUF4352 domain-containing protein n=1 Tax=Streptomyces gamaensis TaxID=1763542 RepID=A0ABW0Z4M2_9ACTN